MFWHIYNILAPVVILAQLLFLAMMFSNYRYVLKKAPRERTSYTPAALLTVPCKGIDNAFDRNVASFYALDYPAYVLHFVVESEDDPAFEHLNALRKKHLAGSDVKYVRILVAGRAQSCSQKIHNLLYSCENAPDDVEVFAFADSDACLSSDWLRQIVYPLRKDKNGASTGYRWFVPQKNNLATLALSAINAKVAQMLGNSHFNQAWGGSMAIKRDTFYDMKLDEIWSNALSDDLCLSWAVKQAKKKVVFVPACLVASYEQMDWLQLFEFARRQFMITRVIMPKTWLFGLASSLFATLGVWAGLAISIAASIAGKGHLWLYWTVPLVFVACQMIRAITRQNMIKRLLPEDAHTLKAARFADILGTPIWSVLTLITILSSAAGRTITWRDTRYKMISPTRTHISR
ncbi:hopanoid biosynthesis associated glycosyl transferase protein HpnI [Anaerohalosphaera lusitana]|uniref:Hopanoid biosynthesis associated glycosyl transferase protein HpnI n=1 Tax=Anaerohalosphaera lusitana TaxID=1936003 RepID=A0A1U9NJ64_9BACT|nr:glycosyltransferase [Anaerohalosphaera lusitana]AQT67969.1 hopanoid biosynthesis associated glycosyl transferase protein HpnI [Anaerohalosphaera lusitana]